MRIVAFFYWCSAGKVGIVAFFYWCSIGKVGIVSFCMSVKIL